MDSKSKTTIDSTLLQTLQRILQQKVDIESQIARGPKMTAVVEAVEKKAGEKVGEIKEHLKKIRLSANEKQLLLNQREAKIVDLGGKRNGCESNREYQLLNDQIAAEEAANSVLSDEILELLEKTDVLEADVQSAEKELQVATGETARVNSEVDDRLKVLNSDLKLVQEELAVEEKKLPPAVMTDYRRMVESNPESVIAKLDENCCGNCYTTVSPLVIDQLRMNRAVSCSACGCMLYMLKTNPVA